jgi:hypothetical protein
MTNTIFNILGSIYPIQLHKLLFINSTKKKRNNKKNFYHKDKLKKIRNLFSVFDPSTRIHNAPLNWILPTRIWLIPSRQYLIWNLLLKKLHNEFKTLLGENRINKGRTLIFMSLFSIILFNNFIGLFPYIFTRTSHLTLTLTLALPLWLRFIIFGWMTGNP